VKYQEKIRIFSQKQENQDGSKKSGKNQESSTAARPVCMINKTRFNFELDPMINITQNNNITIEGTSLFFEDKKFLWSEWDQQIILGSYWSGYLLTLVPSK
jgi:hypothetical protein